MILGLRSDPRLFFGKSETIVNVLYNIDMDEENEEDKEQIRASTAKSLVILGVVVVMWLPMAWQLLASGTTNDQSLMAWYVTTTMLMVFTVGGVLFYNMAIRHEKRDSMSGEIFEVAKNFAIVFVVMLVIFVALFLWLPPWD